MNAREHCCLLKKTYHCTSCVKWALLGLVLRNTVIMTEPKCVFQPFLSVFSLYRASMHVCVQNWSSLFLVLLLPTYLKCCLRKGVNNVQWRQEKKYCKGIHRLYVMKIFLAVMIVKRGSGVPKEITSLDIFKKRVKNVCQDKFRYCWSCCRVEGRTKWPLEDPSRLIFFYSLSVFLRLLNIPTITVLTSFS